MIQLREALPTDNAGLLNLTSLSPMDGKISIRIDRNPDFFRLLNQRGPGKLFIAKSDEIIVGCFSLSIMDVLNCGNHDKIHYLADLKIHPSHLGTTLTSRLLYMMFDYLRKIKADLLFLTAADGNEKVMPLLEGRIGLPKFHSIGTFRVYQIVPLIKKISMSRYMIRDHPLNDEIIGFYSTFLKRYLLSPLINETNLKGTRNLVAFQNNDIKASISLIDVCSIKQNVLIRLPKTVDFLVSILKKFNRFTKILNLPEIGEPVKIMYIKVFAFKEGHEDALDILMSQARRICFNEKYCFLSVGIHEKDPLSSFFRKYLHFTFNSLGFIASLNNDNEKIHSITEGIVFEDYSLI